MIVNYLKIILAVAEAGSLTAASSNLFVSQPYLTKIIKNIEHKYNISLFHRHRNGITITEQGKQFIVQAKEILEYLDNLNNINNRDDKIKLTISSFPSSYSMNAYIEYINKVNKNKTFRCHYYEKNIMEVVNDVILQICDIGIIFMKNIFFKHNSSFFHNKNIVIKKIFDTEPNILYRQNHPLSKIKNPTLSDLYKYNLVMFNTKYLLHLGNIDEGYYNQDTMSTFIDYNKFKHITYIQNRGPLHNILLNTNSISIGNHIVTDNHKVFDISCTPLKKYIKDINTEMINNSMYYIHLKNKPLSPYATLYLNILKNYNNTTPPPHTQTLRTFN